MRRDVKKVVIVGDGAVGSTYAHALVTQDIADEIAIIDVNRDKALADSLDLLHSLTYSSVAAKKIYDADYSAAGDADIVVITANAPMAQFDGVFDRLKLLKTNVSMIKSITESVMASGFDGIFLVASNPCDIITQVIATVSELPKSRVIGTGTMIDTSRMRSIVASYLQIDPRNIHGYVLGEHGDSSFTSWSNTRIASIPIAQWVQKNPTYGLPDFETLDAQIREIGFDIYKKKGATSFGIAGVLARLTEAIFRDENLVLPVSTYLDGEYGERGLYIGVPAVISADGVRERANIYLSADEKEKFAHSAAILRANFDSIKDKL